MSGCMIRQQLARAKLARKKSSGTAPLARDTLVFLLAMDIMVCRVYTNQ